MKIELHGGFFRHDKVLYELITLKYFYHHISQINVLILDLSTLLGKGKILTLHLVKSYLACSSYDLIFKFDLDVMLVVQVFWTFSTLCPDRLLFFHFCYAGDYYLAQLPLWRKHESIAWKKSLTNTESVRSLLFSLGFNKKLCWKTLQTLSSVSLRCCFENWLCRNFKSWALNHSVSMSNLELMKN